MRLCRFLGFSLHSSLLTGTVQCRTVATVIFSVFCVQALPRFSSLYHILQVLKAAIRSNHGITVFYSLTSSVLTLQYRLTYLIFFVFVVTKDTKIFACFRRNGKSYPCYPIFSITKIIIIYYALPIFSRFCIFSKHFSIFHSIWFLLSPEVGWASASQMDHAMSCLQSHNLRGQASRSTQTTVAISAVSLLFDYSGWNVSD